MHIYIDNILEKLTVVNGKVQYIDSPHPDNDEWAGTGVPHGKSSSKGTIKLRPEELIKLCPEEPRDVKESKKNTKLDEGTYEEHYEIYEEYCIHRRQLVNQGFTMCDINHDVTMCGSCPYRKSRTMKVKVSSASTSSTKK